MLLIKIKTLFFQFESEEQSFCMHHLLSDLTRSHRKRLTTLMSHVLNVIFRHKQALHSCLGVKTHPVDEENNDRHCANTLCEMC